MIIETIEQGINHIRQGMSDGVACPCCGQLVKLYRRTIYWGMAKGLIQLYHLHRAQEGYYHLRDLKTTSKRSVYDLSDFSKLKHWGLIYPCPVNDNPKTKSSGLWHITDKGIEFVEDRLRLPKYAYVFNDTVYDRGGELVGIRDALGEEFDYYELMGYLV